MEGGRKEERLTPSLGRSLGDTGGESVGVHETVGSISGGTGLANDELALVDTGSDDLEERRVGERGARGGEQTVAVGVLGRTLCIHQKYENRE